MIHQIKNRTFRSNAGLSSALLAACADSTVCSKAGWLASINASLLEEKKTLPTYPAP